MEEFEFEFDEDKMMEDSYQIITGRKTQEQILSNDQRDLVLIFNPNKEYYLKAQCYDDLIEYFISTEEYERCEELLYLKNEIV